MRWEEEVTDILETYTTKELETIVDRYKRQVQRKGQHNRMLRLAMLKVYETALRESEVLEGI